MMSFNSLPGTKTAAECNPKEILIARETYEYACLLSVALCAALPESERSDDQGLCALIFGKACRFLIFHITGFARHMAQVKTCYSDYASVLPISSLQFQLQGLNLMFLLANNKIAEFHTELELIPVSSLFFASCSHRLLKTFRAGGSMGESFHSVPYQIGKLFDGGQLSEGQIVSCGLWRSLHTPVFKNFFLNLQVLSSIGDVPASSYNLFVNLLSGTVRDSIADSRCLIMCSVCSRSLSSENSNVLAKLHPSLCLSPRRCECFGSLPPMSCESGQNRGTGNGMWM